MRRLLWYRFIKGAMVDVGTTVGIIAAQSIGEPGTQLTMRTFHVGGIASVAEQSSFVSKYDGIVQIRSDRTVKNREGQTIVLSRKAKLLVLSPDGRELQRHDLEYGTQLLVDNGQKITVGTKLAEWDPHNKLLLTEKAGIIRIVDLIDNVTVQERFDETTRRSPKWFLSIKVIKYQPAISLVDDKGEELVQYYLPTGSYLLVEEGQKVSVGDVLSESASRSITKRRILPGACPVLQSSLKLACQKILQFLLILMAKLCLVALCVVNVRLP